MLNFYEHGGTGNYMGGTFSSEPQKGVYHVFIPRISKACDISVYIKRADYDAR